MRARRKKRLIGVGLLVLGVSVAAVIAINALQENVLFFVSPSDVHASELPPERQFRLGGLVADGSVQRRPGGLTVEFTVTDGAHDVPVTYTGILPDLFREGQGVIAHGHYRDGVFEAHEVLARHDETYMPPEVMRSLEEAGHPVDS